MATILSATDPGCLDEAVYLLRNGELVCYPTDTVYGLGAAAGNDDAVRRLFAVKGRPLSKPMPLLIANSDHARFYAEVTPVARSLMTRFWPGALTIMMAKNSDFRSLALAGQDKIALRVPDHDLVRSLVQALGEPVTGTSANRTGGRPPVSASEAAFALGEMVSLVIDGGRAMGGQESTVIDITVSPVQVVREGAVSREQLREALVREVL